VRSLTQKKTIYIAATAVIILFLMGFGLSLFLQQPAGASVPRAAIIDQLGSSMLTSSSRYPNQTLIDEARALLYTRFPEVDYYSDNATVDNYRNLPFEGYKLIIWRVHSALDESGKFIAISTSENNDTADYPQYSNGELTLCRILGDPRLYFAITPKFISQVMNGRFNDTVIILMSCNGLKEGYTETAKALQEKGAKAIISWDGWIENLNNDETTDHLLNYLINESDTIQQAVDKIPQQQSTQGPSELHFFPGDTETAGYQIPNYNNKTVATSGWFHPTMTVRNTEAERDNMANHEPEVDSAMLPGVSAALKRSRIAGYEELRP
jgi:hypothetical protein